MLVLTFQISNIRCAFSYFLSMYIIHNPTTVWLGHRWMQWENGTSRSSNIQNWKGQLPVPIKRLPSDPAAGKWTFLRSAHPAESRRKAPGVVALITWLTDWCILCIRNWTTCYTLGFYIIQIFMTTLRSGQPHLCITRVASFIYGIFYPLLLLSWLSLQRCYFWPHPLCIQP